MCKRGKGYQVWVPKGLVQEGLKAGFHLFSYSDETS